MKRTVAAGRWAIGRADITQAAAGAARALSGDPRIAVKGYSQDCELCLTKGLGYNSQVTGLCGLVLLPRARASLQCFPPTIGQRI
jgi:hypothetical protein